PPLTCLYHAPRVPPHTLRGVVRGSLTDKRKWSYRQITSLAEEIIHWHAEQAKATEGYLSALYGSSARAVHQLWRELTMGWQDDGDNARLEALAEGRAAGSK
ncbi:hypothetical protein, partial [Caballeronia calidae]|uniref:hypothetical protein n=1 Tax=Caballeronia calidae TaxID=1777139 RepID=UPI000AD19E47